MEKRTLRLPGFLMLLVLLVVAALPVWYGISVGAKAEEGTFAGIIVAAAIVGVLIMSGFIVLNPNEAAVVQFFGRYLGSVRRAGFHWVTPLTSKRKLSRRAGAAPGTQRGHSRRGAQSPDGRQPTRRALRGPGHAARGQHRHPVRLVIEVSR